MPLQRISTTYSKNVPNVRLYLDDLDHLHTVLAEHCSEITYTSGRYRTDDPRDLAGLAGSPLNKNRDYLSELDIQGRDPWFQLEFFGIVKPRLSVGDDEPTSMALWSKVNALLVEKRPLRARRWFQGLLRVVYVLFVFAIPLFILNIGTKPVSAVATSMTPILTRPWALPVFFVSVAGLGFASGVLQRRGLGSLLILRERPKNDWIKTSLTTLLVAISGTVIGGLILTALSQALGWAG